MGRVRALKAMREERQQRRERGGTASFSVEDAARSGKLVVEASDAGFAYPDGAAVIRDMNMTVLRGDKIGLVGENGTGKTTLVRLMLGDLKPTDGRIRLGTNLQIAYFDQLRGELDLERNALDNLSEGGSSSKLTARASTYWDICRNFVQPGTGAVPCACLFRG